MTYQRLSANAVAMAGPRVPALMSVKRTRVVRAGSQCDAELSPGVEETGGRSCVLVGDLAEGQVGERGADHAEAGGDEVVVAGQGGGGEQGPGLWHGSSVACDEAHGEPGAAHLAEGGRDEAGSGLAGGRLVKDSGMAGRPVILRRERIRRGLVLALEADEVMEPLTRDDGQRTWRGRFVPIQSQWVGSVGVGWATEFERMRSRSGPVAPPGVASVAPSGRRAGPDPRPGPRLFRPLDDPRRPAGGGLPLSSQP